jgi:RNA polymerase sigma-70 factor, ECF subfamily
VDPEESARITERFLAAAATGNVDGLMALLAPDVTSIADGGGRVGAARRPVVGAAKVAAAIIRGMQRGLPDMRFEVVSANGAPAVVVYSGDRLEAVFTLEISGGKITHLYAIANPDKLAAIAVPRTISR